MNVVIIGLGSIAQKHINALQKIDKEVRIIALRHDASSKKFEGITDIYNINEINNNNVDFIIISNPTFLHYETIQQTLSLGLPLFIEKPLYHNLKKGYKLIERARKEGIKTFVSCPLRFHPVIRYLKAMIPEEKHKLNEVNVYCGSFLPEWRKNKNYKEIYSAHAGMGGGVHLDLIHEVDYIYYLFGKPKKINKIFTSKSTLRIDAIDYASYCFEYEHFNVNIILNYYRVDAKRTIELLFEDKTLECNLLNATIQAAGNILFSQDNFTFQELFNEQMQYFYHTEKPMNDISEAWEVLGLVLN